MRFPISLGPRFFSGGGCLLPTGAFTIGAFFLTPEEHQKLGKKAILFVMTDDTRNCDDVAEYLEGNYADLKDAVLVIHTKNNGEISEAASGRAKEELEKLRKQANEIDSADSPYKAIVSVLMLKEGWDVRNVTTIVGLRVYAAESKILPEQTLGRGLRKMYPGGEEVRKAHPSLRCSPTCICGGLWLVGRLSGMSKRSRRRSSTTRMTS